MAFQELGEQNVVWASDSEKHRFDKSVWYELLASKALFLSEGKSPIELPGVRREIAASWMLSLEKGVDPYRTRLGTPLANESYRAKASKSAPLATAAKPAFSVIESLGLSDEYVFSLVDSQGVALLQTGTLDIGRYVERRSVSDESTMGTNAHSLCMKYRMPFQVVGPEHYCCALQNLAASAAPTVDEHGIATASLVMVQPVFHAPWEPWYQKLLSHTAGLVASFAAGVSRQLAYRWFRAALEDAGGNADATALAAASSQDVLAEVLGADSERIVVLDEAGVIRQISPEAMQVLKTKPAEVWGRSIGEYIELPKGLSGTIDFREGRPLRFPALIGRDEYAVEVSLVPKGGGAVLRFRKTRARPKMPAHATAGTSVQVHFDGIFGSCPRMKTVIAKAERFAATHENVLIVGEPGTGKDLFAQAMHNKRCPDGPFMAINCAANPSDFVRGELFGRRVGGDVFTGYGGVLGKIELADGGTLFLDKVDEMPPDLQAALLYALEGKRFVRLDNKEYRQIDFKVISSAVADLAPLVEQGRFREDLLHRLSASTIELPPLRHRGKDKLLLAYRVLGECRRDDPEGPKAFSREAEAVLESYPWPGNIRQMKRAVVSAFYAAQEREIRPDDFPLPVRAPLKRPAAASSLVGLGGEWSGTSSIRALEENAVVQAMKNARGNVEEAASMLGISRATLYRRLKQYRIAR